MKQIGNFLKKLSILSKSNLENTKTTIKMKPEKLKIGDAIGIVSPSNPVEGESINLLEKGINYLENLGFKIKRGEFLSSTNPEDKAKDINNFFSDNEVKAIICTQGGDSAEKTIPFIDWEIIKKNPKIFMGISDITVLLNSINHKTDLITFHGNDICYGFGRNPNNYDLEEFKKILVNGKSGEINSNGERKTIRSGVTTGKLSGGNIRCLLKLADTEYWPDFDNSILILEAYKIDEEKCLEYFQILKDKKVFDKINGVIIGFIYEMQKENPNEKQMEDLLLEFTKEYDFPILKINDFGHNCPNTTLPIGGKVEMDADEKTITIIEGYIK
ncbi:hypothetical protein CMI42_03255 [Candidatus Pacearchaeota archaeon]|nr:hypothetical protein [Candidatus Pacearchaeota archaeon]|tara:strand:- start:405 stop:1391 length:987 start_codon:yes stop_codon:yes gene_type:complete